MKKNLNRMLSAALAFVMLLALLPGAALAAGQADEYVSAAQTAGWVDETADAGAKLTRGEFAEILWKALGAPNTGAASPFEDVSGVTQIAVNALYAQGIVNGTGGGAFTPDGTLTRQEGVTMLARAYALTAVNTGKAAAFADWADVAAWAQDAMAAMVEAGIINGVGGNKLAPGQEITLGEMLKITALADKQDACAVVGISTIGFVDTDGAKVHTIVVEYNTDMTGAKVSAADYAVGDYGIQQGEANIWAGSAPGEVTKVYAEGKYVYIEVNTDYQLGSVPTYTTAVAASVRQINDIVTAGGTVAASAKTITNYTVVEKSSRRGVTYSNVAVDGTYKLENISGFQTFSKEDGTAFHATHCFEEATGEYVDLDLPYALYVPADYDPSGSYAMVVQIHDAGTMGDDPMLTLTESQGNANFASAEVQQIVKDAHGLDGIIVVAPMINDSVRSTRDNWSLSAAVPATWQLLDYVTETYSISMDHIYGTGQSMGGMQIVAMAAQRDNYFAGMWANGCQWGTNYNLEEEYNGASYYAAPADGEIIWTEDSDGNKVDYRNWYYMISDDNLLITSCIGDKFATQTWRELDFLYHDLAGTDLIFGGYEDSVYYASWDPTDPDVDGNAIASAMLNSYQTKGDNDINFVWTAFSGGSHMLTWVYSHGYMAHYEWLLTQTRQSEMERDKQECLLNSFEYADEQLTTADRELAPDMETGDMVYYATGKAGAGTADYNGCWLKMGNYTLKAPNWKAGE